MANGIDLIVNGLLTGAREVAAPVMSGLMGWFYPRNSAAEAVINYAPGGLPATVFGAPTFTSSGFMDIKTGTNGIRFPVVETAALTWIVGVLNNDTLADAAHQPMLLNSHNGSSGISLWLSNHATDAIPAGRARANVWDTANKSYSVNLVDVGHLRFVVMRVSGTASSVRELVEAQTNAVTLAGRTATGRPVSSGQYYSTAFQGKAKVAFYGFWNAALSDTELADTLAFVLNDLSFEGVTTV